MISVICPTMWKGEEFQYQLPMILNHPLIDDIILIDNEPQSIPDWIDITHPKINYQPQAQNIYVNLAWNLGVKLAKNEKLCFMQDDTLFDTCVFDFIENHMSSDIGMIGINWREILHRFPITRSLPLDAELYAITHFIDSLGKSNIHFQSNQMTFTKSKGFPEGFHQLPFGYSMLCFINKSIYTPIPDSMLIHYGDNWICFNAICLNKFPQTLCNFKIITKPSMTSEIEYLKSLKLLDFSAATKLFNKAFSFVDID